MRVPSVVELLNTLEPMPPSAMSAVHAMERGEAPLGRERVALLAYLREISSRVQVKPPRPESLRALDSVPLPFPGDTPPSTASRCIECGAAPGHLCSPDCPTHTGRPLRLSDCEPVRSFTMWGR